MTVPAPETGPRERRAARVRRRGRVGLVPALWLVADAALAAMLAWPAEALLLFVLSPELPLTLGEFAAAMVALLPHVLAVYVVAGPLVVLFFTTLSVGRMTRRSVSVRYILRFALFDATLLAAAALQQWRKVGELLPDLARTALGLMATTLVVAAVVSFALALVDLRRPSLLGTPWIVALGIGVALPLALAGELRRVRSPEPRPLELLGFEPARAALLVEVPGLDPLDLDGYIARGNTPALGGLRARGASLRLAGGPVTDPVALHTTLITGRPPREHGVLGAVRFRPAIGGNSFGILPRGLLLRPLLATRLWESVPVGAAQVRRVALPAIARGLDLRFALVGDPLGWPANGTLLVPRTRLLAGATVDLGAAGPVVCGPAPRIEFGPAAASLPATPALHTLLDEALAEDLCALAAVRALLVGPEPPALIHVRLGGHGRVARQFAGWRAEDPARGVPEEEIAAYRWTLTRYVRALDGALGPVLEAAGDERLVAVVGPMGVRARHDIGGVGSALVGRDTPTGTFAGPPDGVALFGGPGVVAGAALPEIHPLTAVLPTLLWAQGLPAAEDMGPLVRGAFTPEFIEAHPVVALPSYDAP